MEAGNRCYDDRVPEEINRRVIDACSDVLMPYTERSRKNLIAEGIASSRIHVTGNPILEVLLYHKGEIDASDVLARMDLEPKKFMLVTLHREENVDVETRLRKFIKALKMLRRIHEMPIVWSVHPRTRKRLEGAGIQSSSGLLMTEPLGLFDFVNLEKNAACVLTDSGTVQEECCLFKVPNVTLRDVTERPETVEVGSNILSGAEPASIVKCVDLALSRPTNWTPPREYLVEDVSSTVTKIAISYK
jgi:UDP-N-acetylglucosamine 2-epimerase (non-hydrolysing)